MRLVQIKRSQRHMATTFELQLSCPAERQREAEYLLAESHKTIARLEDELSEFRDHTPIAQLNQSGVGESIDLPESAIELLERSETLRLRTDGAFDATIKGRNLERPYQPQFAWNKTQKTARRLVPNAKLSFAAIGKGYALDVVRTEFERQGFQDFLIAAGGSSLFLSGFKAPGEPWEFGWGWERDEDGDLRGVSFYHPSGIPLALGVSGNLEQGMHIRDPRNGRIVETDQTALIGHPSATEADALSTSLFVLGWEEAQQTLHQLETPPAMAVVEQDGTTRWNGVFQSLWGNPTLQSLIGFLICTFSTLGLGEDEEEIDLSDLGMDDFTPYIYERETIWAVLPFLMILFIGLHLKRVVKPDIYETGEGEHEETDSSLGDGDNIISFDRKRPGG